MTAKQAFYKTIKIILGFSLFCGIIFGVAFGLDFLFGEVASTIFLCSLMGLCGFFILFMLVWASGDIR